MAKRVVKKFYPNEIQMKYFKFAYENDLAVCLKLIPDKVEMFWVEKHLISEYKEMQFLRKDQTKKDSPENREVFNEYEGVKKCFEMYEMFYKKNKNN
jgi:hypothetical protein